MVIPVKSKYFESFKFLLTILNRLFGGREIFTVFNDRRSYKMITPLSGQTIDRFIRVLFVSYQINTLFFINKDGFCVNYFGRIVFLKADELRVFDVCYCYHKNAF